MSDQPSLMDGLPLATLQQWLVQAQTARNAMMSGQQVVDASYQQGDGMKRVTYRRDKNDIANLTAYIGELMAAIGKLNGNRVHRRAIGVSFR
jgi:hypothetical protein